MKVDQDFVKTLQTENEIMELKYIIETLIYKIFKWKLVISYFAILAIGWKFSKAFARINDDDK